jgi:hypothetical protein
VIFTVAAIAVAVAVAVAAVTATATVTSNPALRVPSVEVGFNFHTWW